MLELRASQNLLPSRQGTQVLAAKERHAEELWFCWFVVVVVSLWAQETKKTKKWPSFLYFISVFVYFIFTILLPLLHFPFLPGRKSHGQFSSICHCWPWTWRAHSTSSIISERSENFLGGDCDFWRICCRRTREMVVQRPFNVRPKTNGPKPWFLGGMRFFSQGWNKMVK